MRKYICLISMLLCAIIISGCGGDEPSKIPSSTVVPTSAVVYEEKVDGDVDIDLTQLSTTMLFSEISEMNYNPEDYIGKTVKIKGQFAAYPKDDKTGYYTVALVSDVTACCSQGLEFILAGKDSYPKGYPEEGSEITVVGSFETYQEYGETYCHLVKAYIE